MMVLLYEIQIVASQDWPDLTKYAGLVSTQAHGQELIRDLYKSREDIKKGTTRGCIIKYVHFLPSNLINNT